MSTTLTRYPDRGIADAAPERVKFGVDIGSWGDV
jgi:hypothetical protein